jgi:N-acetylglucosaminyldiphosphoundecaprenol N-acetyl-beta-D-mannosaminyltransferase
MPDVLFIGVGRAFRISIDMVKEAPEWAQKSGMGGMFISKKNPLARIWSTFRRSFILFGYWVNIKYRKLTGKKYYE